MADGPAEWSDLRVLLALARAGSMVAAAKQLGVEHTTIGRRIDALEKALGTRLVGRTRTGITLTDAGREAVTAAEEMECAHASLLRRIVRGAKAPEGRVRVSMTDGTVGIVVGRLPALHARYPGVQVEMQTTPALVSIEKGEADIAIRFVRPVAPSLVAQRISDVGWSLYASASYLARRGRPVSTDALDGHDLIGFDGSLDKTPGARWLAERERGGRTVARVNTIGSLVALLAAGQGIGILPCFAADGLERITPEVLGSNDLYLVVHEDQRDEPRVRVVFDHLVATLTDESARLSGRVSASAQR